LLQKKEPQLVEEERTALFMRSTTCNETMRMLLLDLYKIHGPETSKNFTRKTEERPFENDASFRFLCEKNNASLFALGSHTKKRPDNLVLARMFEFNVLDMFELGLTSVQHMASFRQETFAVGSRPFMVFQGDVFENHPTYQQLKSLFMDFFCSKPLVSFSPSALRQGHAIVLTALPNGSVAFRHYRVDACAVEGRTAPGAQLTEIGPRYVPRCRCGCGRWWFGVLRVCGGVFLVRCSCPFIRRPQI
jgi:ribosome production factor 2